MKHQQVKNKTGTDLELNILSQVPLPSTRNINSEIKHFILVIIIVSIFAITRLPLEIMILYNEFYVFTEPILIDTISFLPHSSAAILGIVISYLTFNYVTQFN